MTFPQFRSILIQKEIKIMENTIKQKEPKLTKKQIIDLRIQKAIAESEEALKNNPQWVSLEEFYNELDKI